LQKYSLKKSKEKENISKLLSFLTLLRGFCLILVSVAQKIFSVNFNLGPI